MFRELTDFIEKLEGEEYGTWVVDKENDGGPEHPIQMSYVNYGEATSEFRRAIYQFEEQHPEYEMNRYRETLEKAGIKWGTHSMESADVGNLDVKTVLALIIGAIRADRFCEGALLGFMKSGTIGRWLIRLRELEGKQYG